MTSFYRFTSPRGALLMSRIALCGVLGILLGCLAVPQARAASIYVATLDGPSESPPNASPGTGFATITLDTVLHSMRVEVTFSGLLGTTTASHIHAATPVPGTGVAPVATQVPTFTGFPLGVTSGTYDHTFDTSLPSTWNPAYVTANGGTALGAEAALAAALAAGKAYLNIHTSVVPGGEIRGFLSPIPEPSSLAMGMTATLLGLGLASFRRRRKGDPDRRRLA
jgi:hypothetical protein